MGRSLRAVLVEQFGKPQGLLGRVVRLILRFRPSNASATCVLSPSSTSSPTTTCWSSASGLGSASARAAELAARGKIVGVDHSALMVDEARRRNAKLIVAGRAELLFGGLERLSDLAMRFDKAFAINVYMFWEDPVAALRALRTVMKPGGTVAMVVQPRTKGASNTDTLAVGDRIATSMRSAGFREVRVEVIEMAPVNTACAIGKAAPTADAVSRA